MMIRVTDNGPGGKHFLYLNPETQTGVMTSAKDGHTHKITYDPPRPPQDPTPAMLSDPTTGEQIEAPQDPNQIQDAINQGLQFTPGNPGDPGKESGEWIIKPAQTADGELHSHTISEYEPKVKEISMTDKELLDEAKQLWRQWRADEGDSIKKGRESEDFVANKQWDSQMKQKLESIDRAALTINEIAPAIDTLVGYQMDQRTEIRYLPQESGDQVVADILNIIVKSILDRKYYQREKTKVFRDQCIPGKGVFNIAMDFVEDIQGIPIVERFPWDDCSFGPHEKEDLSDCEGYVKSRMQSLAWLEMHFKDKAQDLKNIMDGYAGQYPDVSSIDSSKSQVSGTNNDYRTARKIDAQTPTLDGSLPLIDVQKKQFRFAEMWRKVYKEVTVLYNYDDQFFLTAEDWDDDDIKLAMTLPGFQASSQMRPRIRITKFCGDVLLSDENPATLPVNDFFVVPAYAYRQNGEYWGKVEAVKDPQRELNKRRSQIMDQANRLGASVYYHEPSTFINKQEEEKWKAKRSQPGATFLVNNINTVPHLEKGGDIPPALVQIMQLDQQNLQRLMNVVVAQGGANESGALFLERKKTVLGGNQFLLDNLSFAEQKLGKLMASIVQTYYPPERILRILNAQYTRSKFKLAGEDYKTYSKDDIEALLDNADFLEYDVIVADSSLSASTRTGIAQMLLEAIQKGAQIPMDLPLKFIDMPADVRKDIDDRMQQAQQAQSQQAQDTNNTEIKKTLLAKGQYTVAPDEAAQMGLVPAPGAPSVNQGLPNAPQTPNNQSQAPQAGYADNLSGSLGG